jgi:hypothetical protein
MVRKSQARGTQPATNLIGEREWSFQIAAE